MYEAYHHITIPIREDSDSDETCEYEEANVVGNLCENNDWFAKKRLLPKASVGDLFIIYDTGAHAHSMGFQYNAKTRAPEILLRSNGQAHVMYVYHKLKITLNNSNHYVVSLVEHEKPSNRCMPIVFHCSRKQIFLLIFFY